MELDELTPTGYFSEFSWHSSDEDELADVMPNPFEDADMLATSSDAPQASDAKAGSSQEEQATFAD